MLTNVPASASANQVLEGAPGSSASEALAKPASWRPLPSLGTELPGIDRDEVPCPAEGGAESPIEDCVDRVLPPMNQIRFFADGTYADAPLGSPQLVEDHLLTVVMTRPSNSSPQLTLAIVPLPDAQLRTVGVELMGFHVGLRGEDEPFSGTVTIDTQGLRAEWLFPGAEMPSSFNVALQVAVEPLEGSVADLVVTRGSAWNEPSGLTMTGSFSPQARPGAPARLNLQFQVEDDSTPFTNRTTTWFWIDFVTGMADVSAAVGKANIKLDTAPEHLEGVLKKEESSASLILEGTVVYDGPLRDGSFALDSENQLNITRIPNEMTFRWLEAPVIDLERFNLTLEHSNLDETTIVNGALQFGAMQLPFVHARGLSKVSFGMDSRIETGSIDLVFRSNDRILALSALQGDTEDPTLEADLLLLDAKIASVAYDLPNNPVPNDETRSHETFSIGVNHDGRGSGKIDYKGTAVVETTIPPFLALRGQVDHETGKLIRFDLEYESLSDLLLNIDLDETDDASSLDGQSSGVCSRRAASGGGTASDPGKLTKGLTASLQLRHSPAGFLTFDKCNKFVFVDLKMTRVSGVHNIDGHVETDLLKGNVQARHASWAQIRSIWDPDRDELLSVAGEPRYGGGSGGSSYIQLEVTWKTELLGYDVDLGLAKFNIYDSGGWWFRNGYRAKLDCRLICYYEDYYFQRDGNAGRCHSPDLNVVGAAADVWLDLKYGLRLKLQICPSKPLTPPGG